MLQPGGELPGLRCSVLGELQRAASQPISRRCARLVQRDSCGGIARADRHGDQHEAERCGPRRSTSHPRNNCAAASPRRRTENAAEVAARLHPSSWDHHTDRKSDLRSYLLDRLFGYDPGFHPASTTWTTQILPSPFFVHAMWADQILPDGDFEHMAAPNATICKGACMPADQ